MSVMRDINDEIRELLRENTIEDTAEKVWSNLSVAQRLVVGRHLLDVHVAEVNGRERRGRQRVTLVEVGSSDYVQDGAKRRYQVSDEDEYRVDPEKFLDGWYRFGDGRPYVRGRDLTVQQVLQQAQLRHEKARQNEAWAAKFDRLAAVMRKKRARTVGDLPKKVLDEALNGKQERAS